MEATIVSPASDTIRRQRLERGWSQEELAFRAGLAVATVRSAELQKHQPRRSTLRVLELALTS